jgi:hypothetical protein
MGKSAEEGAKTYLLACLTDDIYTARLIHVFLCGGKVRRSYNKPVIQSYLSYRSYSIIPTNEGLEVQHKAWNELAEIIVKLAPETKPVWGLFRPSINHSIRI